MLNRKRVNKGMKRMNSLSLSPVVLSYATLQGKPLPTSPAEQCGAELVPRPFRTLQICFYDKGGENSLDQELERALVPW